MGRKRVSANTPRKIRATLDQGRGAVLLEGPDLQAEEIRDAVRARFPADDDFVREIRAVLVEYDDGSMRFAFRMFDAATRVVGDTIYL